MDPELLETGLDPHMHVLAIAISSGLLLFVKDNVMDCTCFVFLDPALQIAIHTCTHTTVALLCYAAHTGVYGKTIYFAVSSSLRITQHRDR